MRCANVVAVGGAACTPCWKPGCLTSRLWRLLHWFDTRVLDIQGDWPAFLQVFGLRYWSHNTHPCPLCRIDQNQLQELNLNHTTVDSMPFEQYTTSDYLQDLDQSVKAPWIPTKCFQKCLVTNGLFCYPQSLPNKWN